MTKPSQKKKKTLRTVPSGIAHVKATFNNTIISISDPSGNVIAWASGGKKIGGKTKVSGSRKSTPFAATVAAQQVAQEARNNHGMQEIEVNLKGPGAGRESAVRGLQSGGMIITSINDCTPLPCNGCRPRKRRRV